MVLLSAICVALFFCTCLFFGMLITVTSSNDRKQEQISALEAKNADLVAELEYVEGRLERRAEQHQKDERQLADMRELAETLMGENRAIRHRMHQINGLSTQVEGDEWDGEGGPH